MSESDLDAIRRIEKAELRWKRSRWFALACGLILVAAFIWVLALALDYGRENTKPDDRTSLILLVGAFGILILPQAGGLIFLTLKNWKGQRLHQLILRLARKANETGGNQMPPV